MSGCPCMADARVLLECWSAWGWGCRFQARRSHWKHGYCSPAGRGCTCWQGAWSSICHQSLGAAPPAPPVLGACGKNQLWHDMQQWDCYSSASLVSSPYRHPLNISTHTYIVAQCSVPTLAHPVGRHGPCQPADCSQPAAAEPPACHLPSTPRECQPSTFSTCQLALNAVHS